MKLIRDPGKATQSRVWSQAQVLKSPIRGQVWQQTLNAIGLRVGVQLRKNIVAQIVLDIYE